MFYHWHNHRELCNHLYILNQMLPWVGCTSQCPIVVFFFNSMYPGNFMDFSANEHDAAWDDMYHASASTDIGAVCHFWAACPAIACQALWTVTEWHGKVLHISSRMTHNWHMMLNPSLIICQSGSTHVNLRAQRNSELENLGAVKNLVMKQEIFFFL